MKAKKCQQKATFKCKVVLKRNKSYEQIKQAGKMADVNMQYAQPQPTQYPPTQYPPQYASPPNTMYAQPPPQQMYNPPPVIIMNNNNNSSSSSASASVSLYIHVLFS